MADRPARPALPADLADLAARLGAELRRAGLTAGADRCERFTAAALLVRPASLAALRGCAVAAFASSRDEAQLVERVCGELPGADADGGRGAGPPRPPQPGPERDQLCTAARAAREHSAALRLRDTNAREPEDGGDPAAVQRGYLGSDIDRIAAADFADLSPDELARLGGLMREITLAVPHRRSRRHARRPGGPHLDLRATLARARRTGADPFQLISRAPLSEPRRLVVLCDISGSMEPYARAMIQLLYCAAGSAGAEVFTFATRLTRLTPVLARSLPGPALRRAGQAAPDWSGGTRIGAAVKEFNDRYGRRGLARGAVVLIISDGWDTGDPELLRGEIRRLSLVAYRIVWVNPRARNPGYRPLAAGMAAAWPYCDAVVSAHSLAAAGELTAALADPSRRRAPFSPAVHRSTVR
jgi:uncharacterized protein with von Willebrand factor type A (vWA) domain